VIIRTDFAPNSLEWMLARSGIPTASEFDNLISPTWEIRKGQMPVTYLARKLGEWWLGGPLMGFSTLDMEFGQILEEQAIPFYELEYGVEIQRVAFITTDDGRIGCSPDGLIGDGSGIEIKCPEPHTHVQYLLDGDVPSKYLAQVHGAMYVTGRPTWQFMSYRRRFPHVLVHVERDDEIQQKIDEALLLFLARFERGQQRLIELNGGPPTRPAITAPQAEFYQPPADVPH